MKCVQLAFTLKLSGLQLLLEVRGRPAHLPKNPRGSSTPPPTFVVEESLHFHGRPGVCDAEHGAGHDALLGRGAVGGAHQAPVGLVVEPLQDLHSLAPPHRQLPAAAVGGHEVVAHHRQLAAAGQLRRKREKN